MSVEEIASVLDSLSDEAMESAVSKCEELKFDSQKGISHWTRPL